MSPEPASPAAAEDDREQSSGLVPFGWRTAGVITAIFLSSRVVALVALWLAQIASGQKHLFDLVTDWDSGWYLSVAVAGYPSALPAGTGYDAQSRIAFFPGLPVLVDGVSTATGLSEVTAGLIIVTIGGVLAALVVAAFADELAPDRRGVAGIMAATLFSFFPGAYAFSLAYPESWFIAASMACLLSLRRERWLAAGVAAAVASAFRPNGVALVACCAWAAGMAILRRREWRAVVAPLLAPLGAVGFFAFLWARTGDPLVWTKAQGAGWGQDLDFGASAIRVIGDVFEAPLSDVNRVVQVSTLIVAIVACFMLARLGAGVPTWIFVGAMLLPVVLSAAFPITPRTVVSATPLVIALAIGAPARAHGAMVGASAVLMCALLTIATTTLHFTP